MFFGVFFKESWLWLEEDSHSKDPRAKSALCGMQTLSRTKWAQVLQVAVWVSHMEILRNLFTPPSAPVCSWLCLTWKLLEADTDSSSGSSSSPIPLGILRRRLFLPTLRCLRVYLGFVVWAQPRSSIQNSNKPKEKFNSLDTDSEGSIHLPSCCHLETPRVSKISAKGRWMAQDQQEAMEQELEAKWATARHQVALNTLFLTIAQPLAKQDLGFSSEISGAIQRPGKGTSSLTRRVCLCWLSWRDLP